MVFSGVMFGRVVGEIGFAGFVVDMEVALTDAIADPEKAHIHGFGSLLFDVVVDDWQWRCR